MLRLGTLLTRSLALAALCALALAACGSQHPTSTTTTTTGAKATDASSKTLYIYSSLPHNGPQAAESHQIEQGVEFALANVKHRVGSYLIKYRHLSDSTPQRSSRARPGRRKGALIPSHGWNAAATVTSAETAARSPQTVAYIGDLDSGATQLSLPILNQAGIVQLTPGSGYPGLTEQVTSPPGVTQPGEPAKYYPQRGPSLLRLIPTDLVQAAAAVEWLKKDSSCHTLAAATLNTSDTEATAMVAAIKGTAKLYGLTFVPTQSPGNDLKAWEAYASVLAQRAVNCFVLTGNVTRAAVGFTNELNLRLPIGSAIVGTSGLCNARWTDAARGGVSAKTAASLHCTTPVLQLKDYLNGKKFGDLYRTVTRRTPTAYTYYGDLAGALVLKAISQVGNGDSRKLVMSNLNGNIASVDLGTYTFDTDTGDITGPGFNEYGLDKVDDGIPTFDTVLTPSPLLQSEA
jgi:branched-chain amino acid transport system substrate-binding protein